MSDEDEQKIADTAAAFMADNSALTIKQMTASEDVVKELLELATIRTRVYNAVIAEADTNVSDEEAAQKKAELLSLPVADTPTMTARPFPIPMRRRPRRSSRPRISWIRQKRAAILRKPLPPRI